MSTTTAPETAQPSVLRRYFPALIFTLGAVVVAVSWLWPEEHLTVRAYRVVGTVIGVGLPALLSLLWLLFFAPYSRAMRLTILAIFLVPLGGLAAAIRWDKVRLTGDLIPTNIRWRWQSDDEKRRDWAQPLTAERLKPTPDDWPEYRGPKRDGAVFGPPLATDWDRQPPKQLWRQPLDEGLSSFAVQGSLAVTLEQEGDNEVVVGYELETGKIFWVHEYPAAFREAMGGPGPRSTPTIDGGEVFSVGATGKLVCLDARTGKEKWTADILENNANVTWAMSGSPLVFGDLVVVSPGTQTAAAPGALAAYDRKSGKRIWSGSRRAHAGYSSPMRATLSGKEQILLFDGEGFSGYDPRSGAELWRHPWDKTQENINVAQPLLLGPDRVLISSGYGIGSAALEVKESAGKWTVKEVWKSRKLACKFTSPVLHEGHVYGLSEGTLVCLDATNGAVKWRGERYGHGQLLLAGGLLLIQEEAGILALVEATPEAARELSRFQAIEGRTWNLPVLTGGRALVRNHREVALYDLRAQR